MGRTAHANHPRSLNSKPPHRILDKSNFAQCNCFIKKGKVPAFLLRRAIFFSSINHLSRAYKTLSGTFDRLLRSLKSLLRAYKPFLPEDKLFPPGKIIFLGSGQYPPPNKVPPPGSCATNYLTRTFYPALNTPKCGTK